MRNRCTPGSAAPGHPLPSPGSIPILPPPSAPSATPTQGAASGGGVVCVPPHPRHLPSLRWSQLQPLPGCTLCWDLEASAQAAGLGTGGSCRGQPGSPGGDTGGARCGERGAAGAWGGRGHEGDLGSWSLLSPLGPRSLLSRGQSRQAQLCGDTARSAATGTPVLSSSSPGGAGDVPVAPLSRLWSPPAVCQPLPGWEARGHGHGDVGRQWGAPAPVWGWGPQTSPSPPRPSPGSATSSSRWHRRPGKGSSP